MRIKTQYLFILFLSIAVLPAAAQCAMCRAVLESEEGQQTAKSVNDGIVYLMVIPYVLMAAVGYYLYKNKKK